MATLWQDVRYACRMLAKSPMLTAIMVLTLALGIGANTAIFGMVNGFFLRPLPVKSPDQLMMLAGRLQGDTLGIFTLSYPQVVDFRKQANVFSDVFASQIDIGGLSYSGKANQFVYCLVTGNYFSGLGVQPALGRLLLPSEGEAGRKDPYVVLGYSYWQKTFGGDPGVIGKDALIDGQAATIIGVTPKGFYGADFGMDLDGYVPLNMMPASDAAKFWNDRTARTLNVLARLKPNVSLSQAQASVDVVTSRLEQSYPATDKGVTVRVIPERLSRPTPTATTVVPLVSGIFLALAALVLLLACMNVANILLVRATMRQREMAIRAALGAGRGRLMRQLLTESMLLALLGGAGGILLGEWSNGIVPALMPDLKLPVQLNLGFDWRVFAYALGAALFTGVVVGLWPAWRAGRTDLNSVLHGGGRSDLAGVGRHRVRSALVVAQVAGSLVLLIVAGLFVRSLLRVQQTYMGFDPDHVLNVVLDPKEVGYDEIRTRSFYRDLDAKVQTLPGVQKVSIAYCVPMGTVNTATPIYIEGQPLAPGKQPPAVAYNRVDEHYFDTMRVPLLCGRAFKQSDDENAPLVAIVNQAMAQEYWPNQDPLGKRFSLKGSTGPFVEIVGVAKDGKYLYMGWEHERYFYVPLAQNFTSYRTLQIRSSLPPESLITLAQSTVQELDPNMPIIAAQTMKESLAGPMGSWTFRVGAILALAMGTLGLTLAVVGVYGVVSFAASQRTHEIGIRMALGADRRDILRLVLGQGLMLVIAGVVSGTVIAWLLTRSMATLLMGVSPTDALTFATATVVLAGIGLWACYAPARRAMKLDPMVALRYE
ncbi:MAG: ABC transporter permease [Candidatus Acidiferrales bacterium]